MCLPLGVATLAATWCVPLTIKERMRRRVFLLFVYYYSQQFVSSDAEMSEKILEGKNEVHFSLFVHYALEHSHNENIDRY